VTIGSTADLFAVGIGFDIAGAYLLGRGLVAASPSKIMSRAGSRLGYSGPIAMSQLSDRLDGRAGLASLVVGFLLQAAGYACAQGGWGTSRSRGPTAALVAVLCAAVPVLLVLFSWKAIRPGALRRGAVGIACVNPFMPGVVRNRPYAPMLQHFGEELGYPHVPDETSVQYVERVFNVPNAIPTGPHSSEDLEDGWVQPGSD
jgi:hypothetical protein